MSWLSELVWSNRDEHIDAMLTGDAELDESVVSTYDRPQGFKFKLAQRLAAGLLPTVGENDKGKTLQTNETTGAPEWSAASGGGGGVMYATFTEDNGTWSCDKTYAELKAAYDAGSVVIAVYGMACTLMSHAEVGGGTSIMIGNVIGVRGTQTTIETVLSYQVGIMSNETVICQSLTGSLS